MLPSHESRHSTHTAQRLAGALVLTSGFFAVELAGAFYSGSLALLADASHMGADALALIFALFANRIARWPANWIKTYGYHRLEVIAGMLNAMAIWMISGMILVHAFRRLLHPTPVLAVPMTAVAVIGLAVNLLCAWILSRRAKHNENIQGAYLHVLSDALGSTGAIAGGLLIHFTGEYRIDPVFSIIICALILTASFRLIWHSFNILLEGAPAHLNVQEIQNALHEIEGVQGIHDLHVWSLGTGMDILSGHLEIRPDKKSQIAEILERASAMLKTRFSIEHSTLQPEIKG